MGFYENTSLFPRWLAGLHTDYETVLQRFLRGTEWNYTAFKSIANNFGLLYIHNCGIGRGKRISEQNNVITMVILQTSKNYWLDYPFRNVRSSGVEESVSHGCGFGYDFDETKMTQGKLKAILGGFYLMFYMYEGRIIKEKKSENVPVMIDELDVETMNFFRNYFAKIANSNPQLEELKVQYNRIMLYLVGSKAFHPVLDTEMRGLEPYQQIYQRYMKSKVMGLLIEELEVKHDLVTVENRLHTLIGMVHKYDAAKVYLQFHFTHSLLSYFAGSHWRPFRNSLLASLASGTSADRNQIAVYAATNVAAESECGSVSGERSLLELPSTGFPIAGNELVVYDRATAEASIARWVAANGYLGYNIYARPAHIMNSISYNLSVMEQPVMTVRNISSNVSAYRHALHRAKKRFRLLPPNQRRTQSNYTFRPTPTRGGIGGSGRGKGNVWKYMKPRQFGTLPQAMLAAPEPPSSSVVQPDSFDELVIGESGESRESTAIVGHRGRGPTRGKVTRANGRARGRGAAARDLPAQQVRESRLEDSGDLRQGRLETVPGRGRHPRRATRANGRARGRRANRGRDLPAQQVRESSYEDSGAPRKRRLGTAGGRGRHPRRATRAKGRARGRTAARNRDLPAQQVRESRLEDSGDPEEAAVRGFGRPEAIKGRGRNPGRSQRASGRSRGIGNVRRGRGHPAHQIQEPSNEDSSACQEGRPGPSEAASTGYGQAGAVKGRGRSRARKTGGTERFKHGVLVGGSERDAVQIQESSLTDEIPPRSRGRPAGRKQVDSKGSGIDKGRGGYRGKGRGGSVRGLGQSSIRKRSRKEVDRPTVDQNSHMILRRSIRPRKRELSRDE